MLSREHNRATFVELLCSAPIRPVVDERMFGLEEAADSIDYLTTDLPRAA